MLPMTTKLLGLVATLSLVLCFASSVQAVDIGQYCWSSQFIDSLRLSVDQRQGATTMFGLFVDWNAPGAYRLLGAGTARMVDGSAVLGATMEQPTNDFFSGNHVCRFRAVLDSALTGTADLECVGTTTPPFTVPVTLTPVSCVTLSAREEAIKQLSYSEITARSGKRAAGE
jgi:hypothetical protein